MLDNFFADKGKNQSAKDVVLQNYAENTCIEQRGHLNEKEKKEQF